MLSRIGERLVLSVDWDARYLRLVHAGVRKQVVRIKRMLSVEVPKDVDVADPEAVGKLIRGVLDQQKIRTDRVILDVPRDQALLTTLNLPAASADEMPALVEFQIAKEIPFPVSQAVVDFAMPAFETDSATVDVLVGTVRREVVAYYEKTCAAAGLKLERLGLRPYANKVAMNELLGAGRYACAVLVDVGPRLTEIDIIADGQLAFSRAASVVVPRPEPDSDRFMPDSSIAIGDEEDGASIIQFPATSGAGAESDVDRVIKALLVEVTRSIEAYRAQKPGTDVEMIVVGGSVGIEAKLAEAIGRRFSTSVELYNPARQFGWPEERGREARGFAAALGLVCGHATEGRLHFDFLNPKKAVTVAERRLRRAPAVVAVAALFTAAAVVFYVQAVKPLRDALKKAESNIATTKEELKELREFGDTVLAQAVAFEAEQVVWVNELRRLQKLMPDNSKLLITRLDMYHKGARINIPLQCASREVAAEARDRINAFKLNGVPHYDAKLNAFTERAGGGQYPATGSIEVVVVGKPAAMSGGEKAGG